MTLQVWTDGSCLGNPGPGGWAFYIPDRTYHKVGGASLTTNNRMELQAVREAMRYGLNSEGPLVVWSDSLWAINCSTRLWTPKIHLDLFEDIWTMWSGYSSQRRSITLNHVRGHSNSPQNNYVDRMANQEAHRWKSISK